MRKLSAESYLVDGRATNEKSGTMKLQKSPKKDESFGGLGAWVLNLEAAVAEAALESTASTSLVLAPFAPAMHAVLYMST